NILVYLFVLPDALKKNVWAFSLMGLAFIYSVYVLIFKPYKRYPVLLSSYFTTITDISLICGWIYATGEFYSPFYPLLYLSIITIAFRYNRRVTFYASIFYVFTYFTLLYHEIPVH